MSLGSRIRHVRKANKLTQGRLAALLGVTSQAVSQWERDETTPTFDNLAALSAHLGPNIDWLLGKEGPEAESPPNRWFVGERSGMAPLVSSVTAGRWSDVYASHQVTEDTKLFEPHAPPRGSIFALVIDGESMEPDFQSGDVIIVDTGVQPMPGDFVVAKLEGTEEATFKKYRQRGTDEKGSPVIELAPLNPDYPTLTLNSKNPGRIVGTMVEHRRFRRRG